MKFLFQAVGGLGIGIYSGASGIPLWLCILFCAAWAILVEVIYADAKVE